MEAGVLRPVDPRAVSALVGLGLGSLATADEARRRLFGIDLREAEEREAFAAQLADILLYGLLAEPERTVRPPTN